MYALSTLVMTHRDMVRSFYRSESPAMETERKLDYSRVFPTGTTREEMATQILRDIGLVGAHSVGGGKDGKPLVITRQHALATRRVTFDPGTGKLSIQREEFRAQTFLERMHRRRGYQQPYVGDDTWGFTVDLAVVTMAFWSLSGIWLWWELRSTRGWGALCLATGVGLFAIFLVML